ncbi:MAG: response regulator [Chitinophagales bacterium]|nr:response regulator [Chitinophagales bacterium]
MKVIVVDSRASHHFLPKAAPDLEIHPLLIEDTNQKSAYKIAEQINELAYDSPGKCLLFINVKINYTLPSNFDFYYGIQILKEIRVNGYYKLPSRIRKMPIVMYSLDFSLERLLQINPEFMVIVSPGTSYHRLPFQFNYEQLKTLSEKKIMRLNDLKPYFMPSDKSLDKRHSYANIWAANQFIKNYKLLFPLDALNIQSDSLHERRGGRIRDIQFIYTDWLDEDYRIRNKKVNQIRQKVESLRQNLLTDGKQKQIILIDDQSENIGVDNKGWRFIYSEMLFGNSALFTSLSVSMTDEKMLSYFSDNTDCVLLDLILSNDDKEKPTEETRGAILLRKIKKAFPMTPVIITTASNKAQKRKVLRKIGCDAFWTKEGIDERLTPIGSLNRYVELLQAVNRLTSKEFLFLKKSMEFVKKIASKKQWWENHGWLDHQTQQYELVEVKKDEIVNKLMQALYLIRSFLQNKYLEIGYRNKLEESFWLSGVIIKLAAILEYLHTGKEGTASTELMQGRKDYLGVKLYDLRHRAAYYQENNTVDFNYLGNFMKALFCYLQVKPKRESNQEDFDPAKASMIEIIYTSKDYKKFYVKAF